VLLPHRYYPFFFTPPTFEQINGIDLEGDDGGDDTDSNYLCMAPSATMVSQFKETDGARCTGLKRVTAVKNQLSEMGNENRVLHDWVIVEASMLG